MNKLFNFFKKQPKDCSCCDKARIMKEALRIIALGKWKKEPYNTVRLIANDASLGVINWDLVEDLTEKEKAFICEP